MAEQPLRRPGPDLVDDLVAAVLAGEPRLGRVRLVTIDGPSGSGKSTLGIALQDRFAHAEVRSILVSTDHFATWEDPFRWWERLERGVLQPLSEDRAGSYVANEWSSGAPRPTLPRTIDVPEVLIVEGVSAGRAVAADRSTLAIWVEHADRAARRERAVARDGEQIRPAMVRWQTAEDEWFATDGTKSRAGRTFNVN